MIVEIACPTCAGHRTILEKSCHYCGRKGTVLLTRYLTDVGKITELNNVLDFQQKMSLTNQQ